MPANDCALDELLPNSEVLSGAAEAPLAADMPPLAIESSVFMPFESVFGTSVNAVDFCCAVDVVAVRPPPLNENPAPELLEEAAPMPKRPLPVEAACDEEDDAAVLPKLNGAEAPPMPPLIFTDVGAAEPNKLEPIDAKVTKTPKKTVTTQTRTMEETVSPLERSNETCYRRCDAPTSIQHGIIEHSHTNLLERKLDKRKLKTSICYTNTTAIIHGITRLIRSERYHTETQRSDKTLVEHHKVVSLQYTKKIADVRALLLALDDEDDEGPPAPMMRLPLPFDVSRGVSAPGNFGLLHS